MHDSGLYIKHLTSAVFYAQNTVQLQSNNDFPKAILPTGSNINTNLKPVKQITALKTKKQKQNSKRDINKKALIVPLQGDSNHSRFNP